MKREYDFVVIGGGSAGYAAARTAAGLGLSTAVIEGGEEVGGLCILRGCMPSKTLIESANRYLTLRRAEEFGLRASGISANIKAVRDRKRLLIKEFADYRAGQLQDGRFDFIRGRAHFLNKHEVEVVLDSGKREVLHGETFFIATGSIVSRLEIPGLEKTGYLISDDMLEAPKLPESLVVLGGGAVGLEMAHYAAAMGVKVTVIQRSGQLLKETDEDVGKALEEALIHRGIDVRLNTKLVRISKTAKGKRVVFEQAGKEQAVVADEILQALGRKPAIEGLHLEAAGVAVEDCTVRINDCTATSQSHIFAGGDVSGPHEIVHVAIHQGEVAARNAARHLGRLPEGAERADYSLNLFAVFTEPQVAVAGMTERELKALGRKYRMAKYPFNDHGKALAMGEKDGFVKLIADEPSGRIIGAAVVGPHASELIHEVVVAIKFGATAASFAAVPHYHPTLSEIWLYPAEELAES